MGANLGRLFGSALLFWLGLTLLLPTLPLYLDEVLGASDSQIGWVIGAFALGMLLFREPVGRLTDERGRKLGIQIGLIVLATAPLGYLWLEGIPALLVLRTYHGLSVAAFATGYLALVTDLAPAAQRGQVLGYMTLAQPVGVALGPAIGGFLADQGQYELIFSLSALLGGLSWVVCTWGVREPERERVPASRSASWGLLLTPRLRTPALVFLLVGLLFGSLQIFIPLFIKRQGIPMNPGLFYTAVAVASFSVRLALGQAADRWGRGRLITVSLGCYWLAMVTLWWAQGVPWLLLAGGFEGIGAGLLIPGMAALIADRSHARERGRSFGLCLGGFDLGIALAGPVLGNLAAQLGLREVFGGLAGVALLALGVYVLWIGKNPRDSLAFAFRNRPDAYRIT
ncbi:MFS transporter [Gloeomargarita lithophora]|uniref:MFS transporter n=1 Tax=Gloeomargarita lithophora TaxID=1188228 RepID=UPI003F7096B9